MLLRIPARKAIAIWLFPLAFVLNGQTPPESVRTERIPSKDDPEVFLAFLRYNHNYLLDIQKLDSKQQMTALGQLRASIGLSEADYDKLEPAYTGLLMRLDPLDNQGRSHVTDALAKGQRPNVDFLKSLEAKRVAEIQAARDGLRRSLSSLGWTELHDHIENNFRLNIRRSQ